MPNVLNLASNALGQIQNTPYYGTFVAPAPTAAADSAFVVIPGIDLNEVWEFPGGPGGWGLLHGTTTYPALNGVCMLVFDDRRNLRLVWW